MAAAECRIIVDLADRERASAWISIGDRVMGGRSSGALQPGDGAAVFEGRVSLENGGGFASARSPPGRFDLGGAEGIALRVRGDGRTYRLSLRTDPELDGVSYQAPFPTPPGRWIDLRLPFSAFAARFRGREVSAAPLDPRRIASFGLLVGEGQQGPFRLEVAWIGSYRDPRAGEP